MCVTKSMHQLKNRMQKNGGRLTFSLNLAIALSCFRGIRPTNFKYAGLA